MNTAVVFYTRDGNTRAAAQALAQKFEADVFELEETKKRGASPAAFISAGFAAMLGKKSRLKSTYARQMAGYDRICIGTPVWAGKATPAVNAFVAALDAAGKQIVIFTLQADHSTDTPPKGTEIIRKALEKKGAALVKTLRLTGAGPGQAVHEDDIQKQIDQKMA